MSRLKYHTRRSRRFHRLPFVPGGNRGVWGLPQGGGYRGGYITGEAMAVAFMKYLRSEDEENSGACLAWIVTDMAAGRAAMDGETRASYDGQTTGFLHQLGRFLIIAAKESCTSLDAVSERMILDRANAGLSGKLPTVSVDKPAI